MAARVRILGYRIVSYRIVYGTATGNRDQPQCVIHACVRLCVCVCVWGTYGCVPYDHTIVHHISYMRDTMARVEEDRLRNVTRWRRRMLRLWLRIDGVNGRIRCIPHGAK